MFVYQLLHTLPRSPRPLLSFRWTMFNYAKPTMNSIMVSGLSQVNDEDNRSILSFLLLRVSLRNPIPANLHPMSIPNILMASALAQCLCITFTLMVARNSIQELTSLRVWQSLESLALFPAPPGSQLQGINASAHNDNCLSVPLPVE